MSEMPYARWRDIPGGLVRLAALLVLTIAVVAVAILRRLTQR